MDFESRFVRDLPMAFPDLHDVNRHRALAQDLKRRYLEEGRHYHGLSHIFDCLDYFNAVHTGSASSRALRAAIYYHDAVYMVNARNNEEQSAILAYNELEKIGYLKSFRDRVSDIIMATKHEGNLGDLDQQIMADVDLAGLGADWQTFSANMHNIRKEIPLMSDYAFQSTRIAFFEDLMMRRSVFYTTHFRFLFEKRARENMQRFMQEAQRSDAKVA